MTRQQQREAKALKAEARKQAKIEAKQERQESKAFAKAVEKWAAKGAWIEYAETILINQ